MLLHNRKIFFQGLALTAGFLMILGYMFTPNFNGTNAFHASDNLFNSISKGSTYYIPQVMEGATAFEGKAFSVTIFTDEPDALSKATTLLTQNNCIVSPQQGGIMVTGDLGALMIRATEDSDAMFKNNGTALSEKYGMNEKEAMYIWWKTMKEIKVALDQQKIFAPASFMDRDVIKRAIEVGYNFYGIEGQKAADRWGIILFSLVFYVAYTMWWGYAIFFMFEGLGLAMTAGKKKEM